MSEAADLWLHEEAVSATAPEGLVDYEFYCFGGELRFLYVSQGLEDHATARISFLSMDWGFEPFGLSDFAGFEELPPKTDSFDEMVSFARRLSTGTPPSSVSTSTTMGGKGVLFRNDVLSMRGLHAL